MLQFQLHGNRKLCKVYWKLHSLRLNKFDVHMAETSQRIGWATVG